MVGSANLDLVVGVDEIPRVGQTVAGGDLNQIPGGKGANQAVGAARLGRRVAMIGRVGDDPAGAILTSALSTAGVDTSHVHITPRVPSGVALISVRSDGENAIVVSAGANARVTPADVSAAADLLSSAPVTLLQLEIPIDAVTAAARAAGGTVVLNPAPASADPLPSELLSAVDIIVPNQTELATLSGHRGPTNPAVAVQLARRLRCAVVVVTLGAEGAMVVEAGSGVHIPAPSVQPIDTTAAGDSFCAALADALVGGANVVDAARWAVRVGAATTLGRGAQPSLPTRAEVESLVP